MTSKIEALFGDVIHCYTRAQAIADGVLVDLSAVAPDVCAQHYKHPVACTGTVWAIIDAAVKDPAACNDVQGVVHDVLWMSRKFPTLVLDECSRLFKVRIHHRTLTLKIMCGPGDNAEPVMTVMLPEED